VKIEKTWVKIVKIQSGDSLDSLLRFDHRLSLRLNGDMVSLVGGFI